MIIKTENKKSAHRTTDIVGVFFFVFDFFFQIFMHMLRHENEKKKNKIVAD